MSFATAAVYFVLQLNLFFVSRLRNEIDLLLELKICFQLVSDASQPPEYVFPSLGIEGELFFALSTLRIN